MVLGLRKKFFLIILLGNLLMAVMFATVMGLNFKGQFVDYVNDQDNRRASRVVDQLANTYQKTGSWDIFRRNDPRWQLYLRQYSDLLMAPPTPQKRNSGQAKAIAPVIRHLVLADADKQTIVGTPPPPSRTLWLDIVVEDRIVGYLGIIQNRELTMDSDLMFLSRFRGDVFWIVLGALIISTGLSLPFAYGLVKPIRRLKDATRDMAQGQYHRRIRIAGNDELAQLAQDFNWLAQTLEANKGARQQWVADISHELRTPIAVMQAEIESMIDGIRPTNQEQLQSLSEEVLRLSALVEDLHQLSTSDEGALTYQLQPLELNAWMAQFLDQHPLIDQTLKVHFQPSVRPIWIQADAKRLEQLCNNLLQNNVKYTQAPGALWVTLTPGASLVWEDSGPSVPDAALTQLFDRLYRVEDSRNRDTGGSGLGLAICANIVAAHHGRILAKQSQKGGLAIQISLPELSPEDVKSQGVRS